MDNQTKRAALRIGRLLLGALFVFSGIVKCIDPVGGAIKIGDYFTAWGWVDSTWALSVMLSVAQNIIEFTAGFMLVFGAFVPISSLVALAFMVVFTPLTLYIAIANPVSDCGCFGEALKITNWETFGKNVVFLFIAIVVFMWRNADGKGGKKWRQLAMTGTGVAIATLLTVKGLTDEPIMDFRPYSVGTNINKAMTIPEGAPATEYKTTFILQKDGQTAEFDEHNYPYDDSTWVYVDSKTEIVKEGYVPPIADFSFMNADGDDMSSTLLNSQEQIFLAISPKLEKASDADLAKLGEISQMAQENGMRFFLATASTTDQFFRADSVSGFAGIEFLSADETMLKTIVRSNPGVIAIQNGTIVSKFSLGNMPSLNELKDPQAATLTTLRTQHEWLTILTLSMACVIVWLLIHRSRKHSVMAKDRQESMTNE